MIQTHIIVICGVIFNFLIITFLTKANPVSKYKGERGYKGKKGNVGQKGEDGKKGRVSQGRQYSHLTGISGEKGNKGLSGRRGKWGICNSLEKRNKIAKKGDMALDSEDSMMLGGCLNNVNSFNKNEVRKKWEEMELTSHAARNKGCLFGYKFSDGTCKSPIFGLKEYPNSLNIQWEDTSRMKNNNYIPNNECSYNFEKVRDMCPEEFRIWSLIMYSRECPGVPLFAKVPKQNANKDGYENGESINMQTKGRRKACIKKLQSVKNFERPTPVNNVCPQPWWKDSNNKCNQTCPSNRQGRDSKGRCLCDSRDIHHRKCISGTKCLKDGTQYICQPN